MEVVILIPKETYNTCNFPGAGGGPDLLTPPPPLWIQKSRESVETLDTANSYTPRLLSQRIQTVIYRTIIHS